ncbi:Ku protein [Streptomyces sp. NBC_00147]|uniref:Ku protein n=1 Tax=Streptomyces sp. NBC_00147 TaxID=2975667 RepID=UPI002F91482B
MPRPVWSGYISFGLVSVPTRVYPTVEPPAAPLHLIHTHDNARVRIRKVCELDEKQVSAQKITRGYDTPHGTVTVTDADLIASRLRADTQLRVPSLSVSTSRKLTEAEVKTQADLESQPLAGSPLQQSHASSPSMCTRSRPPGDRP